MSWSRKQEQNCDAPSSSPKKPRSRSVNLFVVLSLAVVSMVMIFNGPVVKLLRKDYIFVEEFVNVDQVALEFPALTVCRYPGFKNTVRHLIYKQRNPNMSIGMKIT